MAVKEKQAEFDEIEWNVETEIQLFFAMNGHKPVGKERKGKFSLQFSYIGIEILNRYQGINKNFHMLCIWEKFRTAIRKDIQLKTIWDHLESMYDLMALVNITRK